MLNLFLINTKFTWATFFVQNKSQIPIHTCGCEKRERRITIHVGTVIWMVRKKWETGNEKTQFSIAKNLGGIWEFTRELWFRNYEKCAPRLCSIPFSFSVIILILVGAWAQTLCNWATLVRALPLACDVQHMSLKELPTHVNQCLHWQTFVFDPPF